MTSKALEQYMNLKNIVNTFFIFFAFFIQVPVFNGLYFLLIKKLLSVY